MKNAFKNKGGGGKKKYISNSAAKLRPRHRAAVVSAGAKWWKWWWVKLCLLDKREINRHCQMMVILWVKLCLLDKLENNWNGHRRLLLSTCAEQDRDDTYWVRVASASFLACSWRVSDLYTPSITVSAYKRGYLIDWLLVSLIVCQRKWLYLLIY